MRIALFNRAVMKVNNLAQVISFLVGRGIHSLALISIIISFLCGMKHINRELMLMLFHSTRIDD